MKEIYEIPIVLTRYGFVKVKADSKEEAIDTVKDLGKIKLLKFFKEKYSFIEHNDYNK